MAIDWDNIEIIVEDTEIINISDRDDINVDSSDRMIVFSGEPGSEGAQGPQGPEGPPGPGGASILYYRDQPVSVASSAQIMRIPASGTNDEITTDTVVLNCVFSDPLNITSKVSWTSYDGYIIFSGSCEAAMTAEVSLSKKGN